MDYYFETISTAVKDSFGNHPPELIIEPGRALVTSSTSLLLRDARDDDNVKAVVLRVNSPGGEVFASEQIRREVAALKEAGKPVVVSMGDVAASGGYWISMNADRIYADPSTITGSIGIFGLFPTIDRSLGKIGVRTDGVSTAKYAGAFDITRPLDPGVATTVQSVIEKGYRDFTGRVAQARDPRLRHAPLEHDVWSSKQLTKVVSHTPIDAHSPTLIFETSV